ncbi:hypothetical protein [Stutzerimonas kunmingensis]|uniref:hypothetical protein n=1 Tax=Stutzerimonas kunmingensis TaxID=1211807 RepID=UPI0028B01CC1|nr:hypothetical protein [Stutzerimonas kunmingensis]
MAGVVLYRRGLHHSREPGNAEISGKDSQRLITALQHLVGGRISYRDILNLQTAVAFAAIAHQTHIAHAPSPSDVRRQLQAMAKLKDAELSVALNRCDTRTFEIFNRSLNLANVDWIPDDCAGEMPGPQSRRWAVNHALVGLKAKQKRGRKQQQYQLELALVCISLWRSHKDRSLTKFARTVFDAAGMRHFEQKRLEQILTRAMKLSH